MTTLSPIRDIPDFAVIIRATWERGDVQQDALAELKRRGLWLSTDQCKQAGISDDYFGPIPEFFRR